MRDHLTAIEDMLGCTLDEARENRKRREADLHRAWQGMSGAERDLVVRGVRHEALDFQTGLEITFWRHRGVVLGSIGAATVAIVQFLES